MVMHDYFWTKIEIVIYLILNKCSLVRALWLFFFSVFFSRPVLGMLLGALIWIATLVPYFAIFDEEKYKNLTR